jgi:hypothetical protein
MRSLMNHKAYLALVITCLLTACDELPNTKPTPPPAPHDKYEMKEDKQGRTIRLNKETGEIAVLEGSALVPVQSPEEAQRNANSISDLAKKKNWPPTQLPAISKDTNVYLSTSWRDGKLYYQFWVTPSPKIKSIVNTEPYGNFQVLLSDAGGFTLIKILVPLSHLTRIVEDDGKISYFEANDSIPATQEQYRSVTTYSLVWHF